MEKKKPTKTVVFPQQGTDQASVPTEKWWLGEKLESLPKASFTHFTFEEMTSLEEDRHSQTPKDINI